jgi:hypothetical protein
VLASLAASRHDTLLGEGRSDAAALTGGYHLSFLVGALFAIAAAALGALVLRTVLAAEGAEGGGAPAEARATAEVA